MTPETTDILLTGNWSARRTERTVPRRPGANLTLAERRGLLILGDLLLVNAALILAAVLWLDFVVHAETLLAYGKWFITLSVVWLAFAFTLDLYNPQRAASVTAGLFNGGLAALLTGLIYQFIPWLTPPPGRRLLYVGLTLFIILVILAWRAIYARFFFQPSFRRRVLVVGQDAATQQLVAELQAAGGVERANPLRGTGYQVVAALEQLPGPDAHTLDPAHALVRLARSTGADEVLVAESVALQPGLHEALLDCREIGIRVTPLTVAYERLTSRLPVAYAERDLNLITNGDDAPLQRLYVASKRLADIGLSLVGLAVMLVLLPFIALANRFTSPGPLFYRQQRVGRGGCPFTLIKLRTMTPDAEEATGAVWAADHDARVTAVGRWLRRMRIDELPQCINVLAGAMSIIGPRPERPQFVGEISAALPIYRARHAVRPGITGWAQIRYRYGNSVEDARIKLEYDLYYVKHAGFALDLLIFLQTFPTMLFMAGQ
ncbi:MAG: exopolysaccharide biosynthesis polyprenyl glycosylphosphotransferase [Chloroflexi bacterium]|nr:exopolysaccharide biosynthesis polyprenyl glycosylphosphotransferase [Chloroflexota bacterium]